MPTIDVHGHYISRRIIDEVQGRPDRYGAALEHNKDGQPQIKLGNRTVVLGSDVLRNLDERLHEIKQAGVDRQTIFPTMQMTGYHLALEQGAAWCRMLNETTAADIAECHHSEAYYGFASVPLQDGRLAARELEYAVGKLGFRGAYITASVDDRDLDELGLEPFWETAESLKVPILIHPNTSMSLSKRFGRFGMTTSAATMMDTTIAAASLIYTGVPDRYPNLKVILPHGGGYLPYQIGRFQTRSARPEAMLIKSKMPAVDYLSYFLYDSIMGYEPALEYLVRIVGDDRVLLGSDHPHYPIATATRVVHNCDLSHQQKKSILETNVMRALQLS